MAPDVVVRLRQRRRRSPTRPTRDGVPPNRTHPGSPDLAHEPVLLIHPDLGGWRGTGKPFLRRKATRSPIPPTWAGARLSIRRRGGAARRSTSSRPFILPNSYDIPT